MVPALAGKGDSSHLSNLDLRVDANVYLYSSSSESSVNVDEVYKVSMLLNCTVLDCRMPHRKWRETKQQASRAKTDH